MQTMHRSVTHTRTHVSNFLEREQCSNSSRQCNQKLNIVSSYHAKTGTHTQTHAHMNAEWRKRSFAKKRKKKIRSERNRCILLWAVYNTNRSHNLIINDNRNTTDSQHGKSNIKRDSASRGITATTTRTKTANSKQQLLRHVYVRHSHRDKHKHQLAMNEWRAATEASASAAPTAAAAAAFPVATQMSRVARARERER